MSNVDETPKKRVRKNSETEDEIDIELVKQKIDYLFANFDIKLLTPLELLRSLLYTLPLDIKQITKEAKKKMSIIVYLFDIKKDENSKLYNSLLNGKTINDDDYFRNLTLSEQHEILTKLEIIKRNDSKKPYMIF